MKTEGPKYIIVTLDDAKVIAKHLPNGPIKDRFEFETGADIQEIVDRLKSMSHCHACEVEGQTHYCQVNYARKLGRRLRRLLERARHERGTNHDEVVPVDRCPN